MFFTNQVAKASALAGMRLARKRVKKTCMALDLTFHDLKAKGISDIEGSSRDEQQISGHKTERQVATFDRKVSVVPTVEGAKTWKK